PADFLSSEGVRTINFGQRVRIASGFGDPDVHAGDVYEWMGPDGTGVDLSDPANPYTDLGWWKPVTETQLIPQTINFSNSDATTVGALVVVNDLRSSVQSYITGATVMAAGALELAAHELATIDATADSSATSSGGNTLNGAGDSVADNAVI